MTFSMPCNRQVEVNHIKNGYDFNDEQKILKEIKEAFEFQDKKKLLLLKKMCSYNQKNNITNYGHYESLIEILLARITHKHIDIKKNKLYQYLINIETWTRYELIMFNNTFFFFTPAANKYILSRAIPSLQKITTLNKLGSESFRLMSNAIIYFIHNDEVNEAIKYIKHLNEVELPSDYIYEKVILKIFVNFKFKLATLGD